MDTLIKLTPEERTNKVKEVLGLLVGLDNPTATYILGVAANSLNQISIIRTIQSDEEPPFCK